MRNICKNILSVTTSGASPAIDANQLVSASFQAYFGDTSGAGTFKVQVSNDPAVGPRGNFTPTNWVDVPLITATIASGASALLTIPNMTYGWCRALWITSVLGAQTISPVADVAGSLAGKYFKLESQTAHKYAIWFKVSGTGSAPTVPGYILVEQDISTGDTAATIGGLLATTIAALNTSGDFTTAGTTTVTVTNKTAGSFVAATDINTGFAFAVTVAANTSCNINLNALGI